MTKSQEMNNCAFGIFFVGTIMAYVVINDHYRWGNYRPEQRPKKWEILLNSMLFAGVASFTVLLFEAMSERHALSKLNENK